MIRVGRSGLDGVDGPWIAFCSGAVVVVEVVLQGRLILTRLLVLQQHLLDPDLLHDGRKLVVVEEVDHGVLHKERGVRKAGCRAAVRTADILTWMKSQEVTSARLLYWPLKR